MQLTPCGQTLNQLVLHFNGYQSSLRERQEIAIRDGISGAMSGLFYLHNTIPQTWLDLTKDFLYGKITKEDSHKDTLRKLSNFLKGQWSASDADAPIIARKVIRNINNELFLSLY